MTERKWTPAPWVYQDNFRHCEISIGKRDEYICRGGSVCDISYDGNPTSEDHANAKLICAAPDLYEALDLVLNAGGWYGGAIEIDTYRDGYKDGEELRIIVERALAKARGDHAS